MIRPTSRAVLIFSLSVPMALWVVSLRSGAWYVALYLPVSLLAFLATDALMMLPNRRLQISVQVPQQIPLGESSSVRVELLGRGYERPIAVRVLLEQQGEAEPPTAVSGEMKRGRLLFNLPLIPRRRGQIEIEAFWVSWKGPLGLIERVRREPIGKTVDVVPDVKGIHEAALSFFARDAVHGEKTQRSKGEGTEFEDLREYAQGMDTRLIDWKRSARHRKLLCKEFKQERNHQIVFGFDTGHLMLEPLDGLPRLDRAVKSALLLAWVSLRGGDLVGGASFDVRFRSFLQPGRGMPYFTQIQRFAAALAYRTEETNFTLGLAELNGRLRRRALVVLFTEFIDLISAELLIESLRLVSRRHLVVFVTMRDPMLTRLRDSFPANFSGLAQAVISDDFLRERSVVLQRIARLGVQCLDVPFGSLPAALLNRYLTIKQRGLL